jgi:tRNA (mo5U34)-methyltransferase
MTLEAARHSDGELARLGPWFHNLHLPDGRQTAPDHPLGDFPAFKWREVAPALPEDLNGKRALDIGCNAGFYSLELARRGADVLAIDHDEHYLRQAAWARREFGLEERIALRELDVYELAGLDEQFDIVLFMGVLYHLRYPLLALDVVAARTTKLLVFQTLTMEWKEQPEPIVRDDVAYTERHLLREPGWPKMAFVERKLFDDPTNWWVPNHAGVEAMARSAGLEVIARPGHEMFVCRPGKRAAAVDAELRAALGDTLP